MNAKTEMKQEAQLHLAGQSLEIGETQRFNHEGCTAGEDTRGRLYVSRPAESQGNMVLCYCHNCAIGTAFPLTKRSRDKLAKLVLRRPDAAYLNSLLTEGDTVVGPEEWHDEARVWLGMGGAHFMHRLHDDGWRYVPSVHGVLIPMVDCEHTSTVIGYQLRRLSNTGPKYQTYHYCTEQKGNGVYYKGHGPEHAKDTIVICEDALSARNIWNRTDKDGLGIMGSNISTDNLCKFFKAHPQYKKVHIALDNDSPLIKDNAQSIAARCRMFGLEANVSEHHKPLVGDPKTWDALTIAEYIK